MHRLKQVFLSLCNRSRQYLLFILLALVCQFVIAQQAIVKTEHVEAALLSRTTHVVPGQILDLALRLTPDEGWHTYWRNPGDTGKPTSIQWQLPEGFKAGDIQWPVPEWIDYDGLTNFGFHGATWLLVPVAVPFQLPVSSLSEIVIRADAKWLVCREVCIPEKASFELVLPVAAFTEEPEVYRGAFEEGFSLAWEATPALREDIRGEYNVGKIFQARINADLLPVIEEKPQVFITDGGIASNARPPGISLSEQYLLVSAEADAYSEEFPEFTSIIVSWGKGDGSRSVEIPLKHNPDLIIDQSGAGALNAHETQLTPPGLSVATLGKIVLFALLGGLILNAMPCVFPVLSLKVMSLVQSGNHSSAERQLHGVAYTAGILLSFLAIAALLMALRAAGQQIGWGFQLQSPWFVGGLVYLLFVLGLWMSGVLEFGSSLQNVGSGLFNEGHPVWNSFLTGVLATIVATPCTAPFMGTAMGVALSQSVPVAMLIFLFMGLGLALPFLIIAFVPALAALLPQPGGWMVRLKEVLAFPVYFTAVWLLWVFARQTGSDAASVLLAGVVVIAFAAWLWRSASRSPKSIVYKSLAGIAVVLALSILWVGAKVSQPVADAGIATLKPQSGDIAFSEEKLQQALARNKTVFINMTADWCITCKVNERVALKSEAVQAAFSENEVVYLKGDWTNSDPRITSYLEKFQRNGVPLYVVYKKGAKPEVLPQILTPDIVINAVSLN